MYSSKPPIALGTRVVHRGWNGPYRREPRPGTVKKTAYVIKDATWKALVRFDTPGEYSKSLELWVKAEHLVRE